MRFGIVAVPIVAGLTVLAVAGGASPALAAFGAFAVDEAAGKYGVSWNQETENKAEELALKGCASDKCKVVFKTKSGECGAIATSETGKKWGGAKRAKREEAEKAALASCEKRPGAAGCKLRKSECNKK